MIDEVINKMVGRIIVSGILATILAIVFYVMTDFSLLLTLIMLLLVLGNFYMTYRTLKNEIQANNIVVVKGRCTLAEKNTEGDSILPSHSFEYRFLVDSEEDGDPEKPAASLYIKGEKKMFKVDEDYCLVFKRNDNNEYNQKNLLFHQLILYPPIVMEVGSEEETDTTIDILIGENSLEE